MIQQLSLNIGIFIGTAAIGFVLAIVFNNTPRPPRPKGT